MHELSLLESVLETLEQQAKEQQFTQVKKVVLEIGALSCVESDALRFAFDVVMKNTLAEQATLDILIEKGHGYCPYCQASVLLESLHQPCSQCGQFGIKITTGQQMKIKELMVV